MIYDEAGNRLVSSHATKNGKRYRYYVSSEGSGRAASSLPKLRLPAATIDRLVLTGSQDFLRTAPKFLHFCARAGTERHSWDVALKSRANWLIYSAPMRKLVSKFPLPNLSGGSLFARLSSKSALIALTCARSCPAQLQNPKVKPTSMMSSPSRCRLSRASAVRSPSC